MLTKILKKEELINTGWQNITVRRGTILSLFIKEVKEIMRIYGKHTANGDAKCKLRQLVPQSNKH